MPSIQADEPRGAAVLHRLAAPIGVGLAGLAAVTTIAARDPNVPGNWGIEGVGLCPFLALTGLWCPLCGGLRAVHALTTLDLGLAVASNVVVVALVLVTIVGWGAWLVRELRPPPDPPVIATTSLVVRVLESSPAMRLTAVGLLAFTVLRNLPLGQVLAP